MTMAGNWERIREVFHAAIEQPPGARDAFLATACAGDESMRREIQSLLAANADATGFLDTPAMRFDSKEVFGRVAALRAGDVVGSFEVVGPLGAGGMGEVYRARDLKLKREVAIKLLPPAFASDPQRIARFGRESRILASLNHPHIATIHSIEHIGGLHLLVLELVEGPTLGDVVKRGRMPLGDVLAISSEIAGALAVAHEGGIIHRDLKPENIKITPSSGVKLLDFGLAKERLRGEAPSAEGATLEETSAGLILGTCAYMSPEQARGKVVDKRTDIWAFGCVLFEMLAGKRAFRGATASDTIALVLERQPDWSALPADTPSSVRRLLQRCLEKDAHRRLHDIADARLELDDALQPEAVQSVLPPEQVRVRRVWRVAGIAALAAASMILGWWTRRPVVQERSAIPARFVWTLPAGVRLNSAPAVSPDGRYIAFTAFDESGPPRVFLRSLDSLQARTIAGTEGAKQPFWSPDSHAVGFFARGRLMRVAIDGGAPVEICAAPDGRGGTWNRDGVIVFSPDLTEAALSRVAASGGVVQPVTRLDTARGDNSHRWPVFLPDGIHFLYFVRASETERRGVYVGRIDQPATTPERPLFRSESEALFASFGNDGAGALLNVENGRVQVRPFDWKRLVVTGDPRTIDVPGGGNTPYQPSMLSASTDVLAYAAASIPFGARLASVLRDGSREKIASERAPQNWPRLSPNGRRLAYQRIDVAPGNPELWVEDLERGTRVRVVAKKASGVTPVWSPDGRRLAHNTGWILKPTLTLSAADGSGASSTVQCPKVRCDPNDWSPDGRWLLVNTFNRDDMDVWMLPIVAGASPRPLLVESYVERDARFSPDGRFIAYVSEETGGPEVSVRSVEGPAMRDVISVQGGHEPVWGRDGKELFFVDTAGMLRSVPVTFGADGRPTFGKSVLLKVPPIGFGHFGTQYDVSADGRVYYLNRDLDPPPSEFGIVLGWRGLVK